MSAILPIRILLHLVRGSGQAVQALTAAMEGEDEFFASPNTLSTVESHLAVMAYWIGHMPAEAQGRWPALDWYGWAALHQDLASNTQPRREVVWYAVRSLVPATLSLMAPRRGRAQA